MFQGCATERAHCTGRAHDCQVPGVIECAVRRTLLTTKVDGINQVGCSNGSRLRTGLGLLDGSLKSVGGKSLMWMLYE